MIDLEHNAENGRCHACMLENEVVVCHIGGFASPLKRVNICGDDWDMAIGLRHETYVAATLVHPSELTNPVRSAERQSLFAIIPRGET
jgi:hypothetical protein